eukprot:gene12262-15408_t
MCPTRSAASAPCAPRGLSQLPHVPHVACPNCLNFPNCPTWLVDDMMERESGRSTASTASPTRQHQHSPPKGVRPNDRYQRDADAGSSDPGGGHSIGLVSSVERLPHSGANQATRQGSTCSTQRTTDLTLGSVPQEEGSPRLPVPALLNGPKPEPQALQSIPMDTRA